MTGRYLFLFCLQRSETISPVFLEWTWKRGRGGMCARRNGGGLQRQVGALALCRVAAGMGADESVDLVAKS